jgi:hypothetical protein
MNPWEFQYRFVNVTYPLLRYQLNWESPRSLSSEVDRHCKPTQVLGTAPAFPETLSSQRSGEESMVDRGQRKLETAFEFEDGNAHVLDYEDYH